MRCGAVRGNGCSDDSRYTIYISHTAIRMYLLVNRTWADGGNGDARDAAELTYMYTPRTYIIVMKLIDFCITVGVCVRVPTDVCATYCVYGLWAVMIVLFTSRAQCKAHDIVPACYE